MMELIRQADIDAGVHDTIDRGKVVSNTYRNMMLSSQRLSKDE